MRRERGPGSEPDCHIIYDEDSHGAVGKAFAFAHLVHGLGLIAEEATRQLVCDCDVTLSLSLSVSYSSEKVTIARTYY